MLVKASGLASEPVIKRFIYHVFRGLSVSISDFVQRRQVSELTV